MNNAFFRGRTFNGLSGAAIKYAAMVSMAADHVAAAMLAKSASREFIYLNNFNWLYYAARYFGRIAFPVFAFCLVEGFLHTRDRKKYLLRLLIFAVISQPPYILAFARAGRATGLNTLFSLSLSLAALMLAEKLNRGKPCRGGDGFFLLFAVFFSAAAAIWFGTDYTWCAPFLVFIFYGFKDNRPLSLALGFLLMLIYNLSLGAVKYGAFTLPAFMLIYFYNGKRGRCPKYFFYAFYPLHLLIIYALRAAVFGN